MLMSVEALIFFRFSLWLVLDCLPFHMSCYQAIKALKSSLFGHAIEPLHYKACDQVAADDLGARSVTITHHCLSRCRSIF
jgi:hypothetical protein